MSGKANFYASLVALNFVVILIALTEAEWRWWTWVACASLLWNSLGCWATWERR